MISRWFIHTRFIVCYTGWIGLLYFHSNTNAEIVLLYSNKISDPPRVKLNLGNGIDRNRISEGQDVYMDCEIRANPRIYKVEWIHNVSCIVC